VTEATVYQTLDQTNVPHAFADHLWLRSIHGRINGAERRAGASSSWNPKMISTFPIMEDEKNLPPPELPAAGAHAPGELMDENTTRQRSASACSRRGAQLFGAVKLGGPLAAPGWSPAPLPLS
jgi:hypothetical protein